DVEFIAQYLQLRDAAAHPAILAVATADALAHAAEAGSLSPARARVLTAALELWRTVQGLLRLTVEGGFTPEAASDGLKRGLARAAGAVDFAALEAMMLDRSAQVLRLFETLLKGVDHGGEEEGEEKGGGEKGSGAQKGGKEGREKGRRKAPRSK